MAEILKKIGEISMPLSPNPDDSIRLDVARNGMFYLVQNAGIDAYGNPKCEIFDVMSFVPDTIPTRTFYSGLVQVIGQLIVERDDLAAKLTSAVRTKAD